MSGVKVELRSPGKTVGRTGTWWLGQTPFSDFEEGGESQDMSHTRWCSPPEWQVGREASQHWELCVRVRARVNVRACVCARGLKL